MAQVCDYTIRYFGAEKGFTNIHAQIHLFGEDNHLLGWLNFRRDGISKDANQAHIVMEFTLDLMPGILSMLRDEAPIYLYWQEKLGIAYFGTGREHVGEGE